MKRVLEGINVVSFALVISAPSTARMLCDLGADVIKIEPPDGDTMRKQRPKKLDSRGKVQSGIFTALNCGQRGISLDLRQRDGVKVAEKLIMEWADVVISNFTPGTLEKFGLGYEMISRQKPGIIYGAISGYGQQGPWANRRAYDICVQSECGITAQNGPWRGQPHRVGFSVLDYLSGRDLCIGILAALHCREKTGQGDFVDATLYNSGLTLLEDAIPGYDLEDKIATTVGSRHPSASPHNLYKTKDGFINIIAINDMLWARLTDMMGRPELQKEPGVATQFERLDNADRVDAIVEEWTMQHTTDEVCVLLDENKLARGKLCNVKEVIESEQTRYWNMTPRIDQPYLGPVRINNCPIKYTNANTEIRGPAPLLGQHNKEVICGILDYSEEQYQALVEAHVVHTELENGEDASRVAAKELFIPEPVVEQSPVGS